MLLLGVAQYTGRINVFTATLSTPGTSCALSGKLTVDWTITGGVNDDYTLRIYRKDNTSGVYNPRVLKQTEGSPASVVSFPNDPVPDFAGATSTYKHTYEYELLSPTGEIIQTGSSNEITRLVTGTCPI